MKENKWGFEVGDIVKCNGHEDEMEFRGEFDGKFYAEFLEECVYGVTQDFIPTKHTGRYWNVWEYKTWTLVRKANKPQREFRVGDKVKIGDLYWGLKVSVKNNEDITTSENKCNESIMSKLTNFVKDSLLSKEEKLMRKHGLKDSCGDYTSEARELAMQKLMSECEDYFTEIVKDMEAEEKANK